MLNLTSFIRFHARRTPGALALIYGETRLGYAALQARIEKTAGLLAAHGIGAGDIVAVVMKNSAAFIEIAFATSHIGAVFLPVNYRLATEEVGYITGHAGAKLIFADEELSALVAGLDNVILVDAGAQSDSTRLAREGTPAPLHATGPDDLFRLMYTSGTTDRPKGVMHTYGNFYWKNADHVVALGLTAADRLLVTGPLYHVGAFDLPGVAVLWVGGTLCIHRDFDPIAAIRAVAQERLTGAWFAPVMLSAILAHPERDKQDVSSLKWVVGGGRAHARAAYPRLHGLLYEGPICRRLRPHRVLQRRHNDGGGARDREDRIGRPRSGSRRGRDTRRDGADAAHWREWRDLPARPQDHARLLEGPGEDARLLLR